jgi:hypothetical protein
LAVLPSGVHLLMVCGHFQHLLDFKRVFGLGLFGKNRFIP